MAKKVVTHRQRGLFGDSLAEQRAAAAFDVAEDIRTRLWAEGRPIIRTLTGKSYMQAGIVLGRLLRDARDDCALLLAALRDALDLRPVEPMPWLVATVRSRANDRAMTERIAGDWDLIGIADLDANAERLMSRKSSDEPGPQADPAAVRPLELEFSNRWGDEG